VQEARDILGVQSNYSEEELKKAYRAQVKEAHPDQGGTQDKFIRVKQAYDLLKNKLSGPDSRDTDFFRTFKSARRQTMAFTEVWVSLQEAWRGLRINRDVEAKIPCSNCFNGRSGADCVHCRGTGLYGGSESRLGYTLRMECPYCSGTGKSEACTTCKGTGHLPQTIRIDFTLPRFTSNKQIFQSHGERPLTIVTMIKAEPDFHVENGELVYMPSLELSDLIRGMDIDILGTKHKLEPFSINSIEIEPHIHLVPKIKVSDRESYQGIIDAKS